MIWGKQLDEIFKADGLAPDLQIEEDAATATLPKSTLSGIPNPSGGASTGSTAASTRPRSTLSPTCAVQAAGAFTFRAAGRVEVWDAVTGQIRPLPQFTATQDGRTRVPLCFAPRQSFFIVFRESRDGRRDAQNGVGNENFPALKTTLRIQGAWRVSSTRNGAARKWRLSKSWKTGPGVPSPASSTTPAVPRTARRSIVHSAFRGRTVRTPQSISTSVRPKTSPACD